VPTADELHDFLATPTDVEEINDLLLQIERKHWELYIELLEKSL
jgi:hypothetical protein